MLNQSTTTANPTLENMWKNAAKCGSVLPRCRWLFCRWHEMHKRSIF